MKIVVVGGGIIGCSVAYHLQKAGASVVLLERGEIGAEASGAAAGMLIAPAAAAGRGPFQDLCRASLAIYEETIADVQDLSRIDPEPTESGILVLAETSGAVHTLQTYARAHDESGRRTEWVEGDALWKLEPALSRHVLGAAFSPRAKHVNPGKLTQAFARAAEVIGADVRTATMLTGFIGKERTIREVSTNLGDIREIDALVLAAGPWTEPLTSRLNVRLRTPPMRGQMIAYKSKDVLHAIWGDAGYLVPKSGGIVFAGATVEDVGFRKATTARGVATLRRMASALVPTLARAEVASAWAGLRPGSSDAMPVIGPLPGKDNVIVATGHFRNGVLLAPITGALVADLVLTGRSDDLLRPFSPDRFAAASSRSS
jgi:glycine oxidase